jgi:hypothetical protein
MFSYHSLIYRGILLFDGVSVTLVAISEDLYLYEEVFPGTTSPKNTWGDYESSLECSNGALLQPFLPINALIQVLLKLWARLECC